MSILPSHTTMTGHEHPAFPCHHDRSWASCLQQNTYSSPYAAGCRPSIQYWNIVYCSKVASRQWTTPGGVVSFDFVTLLWQFDRCIYRPVEFPCEVFVTQIASGENHCVALCRGEWLMFVTGLLKIDFSHPCYPKYAINLPPEATQNCQNNSCTRTT